MAGVDEGFHEDRIAIMVAGLSDICHARFVCLNETRGVGRGERVEAENGPGAVGEMRCAREEEGGDVVEREGGQVRRDAAERQGDIDGVRRTVPDLDNLGKGLAAIEQGQGHEVGLIPDRRRVGHVSGRRPPVRLVC